MSVHIRTYRCHNKMASCGIVSAVLIALVMLKSGLCQDVPTNLTLEIKNGIDSALSSLTCTINNNPTPPTASSTNAYDEFSSDNNLLNVVIKKT